ncbi:DsbA family protein [Rubrobacter calidifluminis]|uniref:DsbA family protein n=1 Tax=Rubrobacter calidifluminis TaxID=1392640 RepID=UPI002361EC73|nr:thioredoxin domain-containing protein [Rubrobacter calidifluminis]
MILALIVAAAIVVAAILVAISQLGGGGASSGEVSKLYAGVPQNGTTLGKGSAPVTIYLYEDFQCPYCGEFSRNVFPRLVKDYVKPGRVKLVSEPMAFIGPDSVKAAEAALAAAKQNRYWGYYYLLFANQKTENSGYVTDDFLNNLAQKTPGLDMNRWKGALSDPSLAKGLEKVQKKASAEGVNSTPTLIVEGPGGKKKLTGDQAQSYGKISSTIKQVGGS